MGSRRVTLQGTDVMLRTKEFDLLARLVREPDAAVSREVLMVDVWDENWVGSTKTLDVPVASLRSKKQDRDGRQDCAHTDDQVASRRRLPIGTPGRQQGAQGGGR
jgi:DNA-binding response OmpR family regulator